MKGVFEAKFSGYCHNECGNRIEIGELAMYADDELVHVGCVPREERPTKVCQSCWLVKPCGCDDEP